MNDSLDQSPPAAFPGSEEEAEIERNKADHPVGKGSDPAVERWEEANVLSVEDARRLLNRPYQEPPLEDSAEDDSPPPDNVSYDFRQAYFERGLFGKRMPKRPKRT